MSNFFNAQDWFWIVAASPTQVYSSAAASYLGVNDARYLAWLQKGSLPTLIDTEANLMDVLAVQNPDGLLPTSPQGQLAAARRLAKQSLNQIDWSSKLTQFNQAQAKLTDLSAMITALNADTTITQMKPHLVAALTDTSQLLTGLVTAAGDDLQWLHRLMQTLAYTNDLEP